MGGTEISDKKIKLALLDLNGEQVNNRGVPAITKAAFANGFDVVDRFDVRNKELPDISQYDFFISSGGPGDPRDWGQNTGNDADNWGKGYFQLLDAMDAHDLENSDQAKRGFFICHSFQLTSLHYGLGELTPRDAKLAGIQQHIITPYAHLAPTLDLPQAGAELDVFENRDYQVKPVYCVDGKGKFLPLTLDKTGALTGYSNWEGTRIGFQFHPEATVVDTEKMLTDAVDERELKAQKYIIDTHDEEALNYMRTRAKYLDTANELLNNWLRQCVASRRDKKLKIA